jgi:predicted nucleic acid-binding protein
MRWLIRKGGMSKPAAASRAQEWLLAATPLETTRAIFDAATMLVAGHDFQIWDAIILAGAASCAADILLTEDMQDGFRWRGVTVVNPFADEPSPLLAGIMAD